MNDFCVRLLLGCVRPIHYCLTARQGVMQLDGYMLPGIGGGQVDADIAIDRCDGFYLHVRVCQCQKDGMRVVHTGIGINDESFHCTSFLLLMRFISSVCWCSSSRRAALKSTVSQRFS